MKGSPRVLILGAGLVARPMVEYLNDLGAKLTVASLSFSEPVLSACEERGIPMEPFRSDDAERLRALVGAADLVVSLLPATMHPTVAAACVAAKRHLVTTSYVGEAMAALDAPARAAGVLLLNEIGLDPGIDHMSAMNVIHEIRRQGGEVTGFESCCGGLPAPDANDNPFGYKFSWSPRGVLLAARNAARYLKNGAVVEVPGPDLFSSAQAAAIDGVGDLEIYPNRDSLPYLEKYGLSGVTDMFRGTFRYPGHCAAWLGFARLGLLDADTVHPVKGATWRDLILRLNPSVKLATLEADVARITGNAPDSEAFARYHWLGILDEMPIGGENRSALDCLADLMLAHMTYRPGERDMVVLRHVFTARFPDPERRFRITSTLVDFGDPDGDTAMSRTVSLPAAIAVRRILEGHIRETGVHIPVTPEIFGPVLPELERLGLRFEETIESLDGEPDVEVAGIE